MAMATKRQSAEYREKEAVAKATIAKCQSAEYREREAQAMATKRQSAEYREREAMAKATKRQSSEYREREKLRLWLVSASQMTSERRSTSKETMPYQREIYGQQHLASFSSIHCSY